MTAVTIPPELADDVAARPEAYRPLVARYDEVFVLRGGPPRVGRVMVSGAPDASGSQPWIAVEGDAAADPAGGAWLLVGSVDGGPRPEVDDHVLVLARPEMPGESLQVGTVRRVIGVVEESTYERLQGRPLKLESRHRLGTPIIATRWALLPDAAYVPIVGHDSEGDAVQVQGGGDTVIRDCRIEGPVPDWLANPGIPPGRWRQGGHAPRNLWIGGAYPEGVDVGRMDTPELAAYVVEAVNDQARVCGLEAEVGRLQEVYDGWRAETERLRALLARLRGFVEAERDRYLAARTGTRDDVSGDKADALDQVLDWLEDRDAPVGEVQVIVPASPEATETAALIRSLADESKGARAEVERLRAALQRIADLDDEQRIVAPDIASGALAGGS
jgi:hypothetical protein